MPAFVYTEDDVRIKNAKSCPNALASYRGKLAQFAGAVRGQLKNFVGQRLHIANSGGSCPSTPNKQQQG